MILLALSLKLKTKINNKFKKINYVNYRRN
jgi:hypothetical protein